MMPANLLIAYTFDTFFKTKKGFLCTVKYKIAPPPLPDSLQVIIRKIWFLKKEENKIIFMSLNTIEPEKF